MALAMPENIASRRVMEHLGFEYEKDVHYFELDLVCIRSLTMLRSGMSTFAFRSSVPAVCAGRARPRIADRRGRNVRKF